MKIGFYGNVNNYPFMVARSLRRMGYEIIFIMNSLEKLHRPEYRYSDISIPYPDWIYDISPTDIWDFIFPTLKQAKIIQLLKACDALILNDLGCSLQSKIKRPTVILITGSDLDYYANLNTIDKLVEDVSKQPIFLRRLFRKYTYTNLVNAQREGIKSAKGVSYFIRGLVPDGDALLDEIGVLDSQRIPATMTDTENIKFYPPPNNWPIRTFCATRLNWKKPIEPGLSELDYKGSDVMIRGLGLFVKNTGTPLNIRLVKKGMDVAETIQLVEEEGLTPYVTWLEEMTQQEVADEFKQADIIFEQFGSAVVSMAGLDAMATGRPVIANGRPEIMEKVIGVPSPICQATTPEEVCSQLQRLVSDPAERERVGLASRQYVEKYFSAEHMAKMCLECLAEC